MYEKKLESLNGTIANLKRQNEEKAEKILELEQNFYLQDFTLNETKQENIDLIENYSKLIRNTV